MLSVLEITMKKKAVIFVAAFGICCAVLRPFAQADVPPIPDVPGNVPEPQRAALLKTHDELKVRLDALNQQIKSFNVKCRSVREKSEAASWCRTEEARIKGATSKLAAEISAFASTLGFSDILKQERENVDPGILG